MTRDTFQNGFKWGIRSTGFLAFLGILLMVIGNINNDASWQVRGSGCFQVGISVSILMMNLQAFLAKSMNVYDEENAGVYRILLKKQPQTFWFLIILSTLVAIIFLVSGVASFFVDPSRMQPAPSMVAMHGP